MEDDKDKKQFGTGENMTTNRQQQKAFDHEYENQVASQSQSMSIKIPTEIAALQENERMPTKAEIDDFLVPMYKLDMDDTILSELNKSFNIQFNQVNAAETDRQFENDKKQMDWEEEISLDTLLTKTPSYTDPRLLSSEEEGQKTCLDTNQEKEHKGTLAMDEIDHAVESLKVAETLQIQEVSPLLVKDGIHRLDETSPIQVKATSKKEQVTQAENPDTEKHSEDGETGPKGGLLSSTLTPAFDTHINPKNLADESPCEVGSLEEGRINLTSSEGCTVREIVDKIERGVLAKKDDSLPTTPKHNTRTDLTQIKRNDQMPLGKKALKPNSSVTGSGAEDSDLASDSAALPIPVLTSLFIDESEQRTIAWELVDPQFHEDFVYTGYRHPDITRNQCLRSMFWLHNETLNVWTHLGGLIYFTFVFLFVNLFSVTTSHLSWLELVPLGFYFTSICMLFFNSGFAHLFNTNTTYQRDVFFTLDYFGISVYGTCTAVAYMFFNYDVMTEHFKHAVWYCVPAVTFTSMGAAFTSCISRMHPTPLAVPLRIFCFAVVFVVGSFPALYRFGVNLFEVVPPLVTALPQILRQWNDNLPSTLSKLDWEKLNFCWLYIWNVGFLATAAAIAVLRIPEKWYPGQFDLIGHSHQWFHVFTFLGVRQQFWLLIDDINQFLNRKLVVKGPVGFPASHLLVYYCIQFVGMVIIFIWFTVTHRKKHPDVVRKRSRMKYNLRCNQTSAQDKLDLLRNGEHCGGACNSKQGPSQRLDEDIIRMKCADSEENVMYGSTIHIMRWTEGDEDETQDESQPGSYKKITHKIELFDKKNH